MERTVTLETTRKIMGRHFIGPEELEKISRHFSVSIAQKIPPVPFSENVLQKAKKEYILILGANKDKKGKPLTLLRMRELFGIDPEKSEPCFYNQDWYLKERFANAATVKPQWHLVRKSVDAKSRGVHPDDLEKKMKGQERFPSAVLCAFTFFAYYFLNKKAILWEKDFVWCSDRDANGDRIYVGRYKDPKKINKNGFNIHRHLSIKKSYGIASEIV